MHKLIADVFDRYDAGRIGRRDVIRALAAIATAGSISSAAEPTFRGAGLNHIAVRVTDIPRTKAFYQDLLGLPLISESGSSLFLKAGDEFLTFFRNATPGLDHYCVEIEGFNPDEVVRKLAARGLKPRRPNGTDRIYFHDPDGLEVQLSAVGHRA
ncbi:MAG TPA: VOC family protein [Bryobacteraceae bacterium]|nr:VOC family protein [Bryobacteraceae bacterium]